MKKPEHKSEVREAILREPSSPDEIRSLAEELQTLSFENGHFRVNESYQIGHSLDVERVSDTRFLIRSEQDLGRDFKWVLYGIDGDEARQLAFGGYDSPDFEDVNLEDIKRAEEASQSQENHEKQVADAFRSQGLEAPEFNDREPLRKGVASFYIKALEAKPGAAWA